MAVRVTGRLVPRVEVRRASSAPVGRGGAPGLKAGAAEDSRAGFVGARWLSVALGALAVSCAALVVAPVSATIAVELDVQELTEQADAVVRGRVVERQSRMDEASGHIFTYTTVEVGSSLKGSGSQTIVIRQLGGEVEDIGFFITGDAVFEVGEEVMVFLQRNKDGLPYFHLVGLAQGKYTIKRDGERPLAARDLSDLSLGRFHEGRFIHRHGHGPTAVCLTELERTVSQAAE